QAELRQLRAHTFGQPRRSLAGGRRQRDAQRMRFRMPLCRKRSQCAHYAVGLAGAGAAGDELQMTRACPRDEVPCQPLLVTEVAREVDASLRVQRQWL